MEENISQEIEQKKEIKKIKKERVRGVVTERDLRALRWVCEQGVMTVDQLWRAVWWNDQTRGPRYAYERVLFLERAKFLEKVKTPYSLKSYFRARKRAYNLLSTRGEGVTLIPTPKTPINETLHVDGLTEMRLAVLRSGKLGNWIPDRVLRIDPNFPRERFEITVPDAIWTTQETKRRIAVEYERTRKGRSRVRAKVDAYAHELARPDRRIDLVLWVAAPGSYTDLKSVLVNHPNQKLRTLPQFLSELIPEFDSQNNVSWKEKMKGYFGQFPFQRAASEKISEEEKGVRGQ
jgi:hypothetical protein